MNYYNNLQYLLSPWVTGVPECFFKDLILDSRVISLNDVFFALNGYRTNGANYILDAISRGAIAIVTTHCQYESHYSTIKYFHGVPIIYLSKLSKYLSAISGRFFSHPSKFFHLVGVTGTNGKSTVTHLLSNWIYLLDEISAIMGTIGNGVVGKFLYPSLNTTCSAIDIQRTLSLFKEYKVTFTAIEISSHGLVENRVDDLYFDVAVFTNLTRDHLDYHGSFFQYELAKWRLFNNLNVKYFVLNCDDIIGRKWLSKLSNAVAVTMYKILPSVCWQRQWLCANKISYYLNYTEIIFSSSWGNGMIRTQLIGEFNVINLLLAMTTLLVLKYPLFVLLNTVWKLRPISGRMELFRAVDRPIVIVDYAHNPESLKQALITARLYSRGKICCVFGCGGDRDKGKRSLMGVIAERYADNLIITNDNPRTEDPYEIINDIVKDLSDKASVQIITSRYEAILTAINQYTSNDLVFIAGKGHEDYQIVGDQKFSYSDLTVVKQLLAS